MIEKAVTVMIRAVPVIAVLHVLAYKLIAESKPQDSAFKAAGTLCQMCTHSMMKVEQSLPQCIKAPLAGSAAIAALHDRAPSFPTGQQHNSG